MPWRITIIIWKNWVVLNYFWVVSIVWLFTVKTIFCMKIIYRGLFERKRGLQFQTPVAKVSEISLYSFHGILVFDLYLDSIKKCICLVLCEGFRRVLKLFFQYSKNFSTYFVHFPLFEISWINWITFHIFNTVQIEHLQQHTWMMKKKHFWCNFWLWQFHVTMDTSE